MSDSTKLEWVQREFLNYISFTLKIDHQPHDYLSMMQCLQRNSLVDWRVSTYLSFPYKLVSKSIDALDLLSKVNFRISCKYCRSTAHFYVPFHHTNYGRNQPTASYDAFRKSIPIQCLITVTSI